MRGVQTMLAALILLTLVVGQSNPDLTVLISPESEQVDRAVLKQFIREGYGKGSMQELKASFANFKKAWITKMIEFLIQELEINEDEAKEVRKNPDSFLINFETYKIFSHAF